jgi:hypothetical protein
MEGHGASSLGMYLVTLPFYFVTVFLSFFPWSLKLPWLAKHLRTRDVVDNYFVTGIALVFGIFTLVTTKLPHYTLPALPLLALLMARHLSNHFHGAATLRRTAIATAVICTALALCVFPFVRTLSPAPMLARAASADLRPEMEFGAVEFTEPSLVWYFRQYSKGWFTVLGSARVEAFMARPGGRFVVLPDALANRLYSTLPTGWKRFSTRGFNIAKGKRVELTLVVKPM